MSMGIPSASSSYPAYSSAALTTTPVPQPSMAQPQAMASPAPYTAPYALPHTSATTGTGTTEDFLMAALHEASDTASQASYQFYNEILPEGRAWQAQRDQLKHQQAGLPSGQAQATPTTVPSTAASPFVTAPPQRDETMTTYLPYYGQAGMLPQTMPYIQQPYGTPYNQPNLAGTGQGITPTDLNALHEFYQKQGLSPQQSLQQIEAQLQSGQPLAPQAVSNNGDLPFRFGLASAGYFLKGAVVDPIVNTAKLAMDNPLGFVLGAGAIGALATSAAAPFLAPVVAVGSAALGGILVARFIARFSSANNGGERAKAFEDLGGAATSVVGAVWGAPKAYGALVKAADGLDDATKAGTALTNMKTAQAFASLPRLEKLKTFWNVIPDATRQATRLLMSKDMYVNHPWWKAVQGLKGGGSAANATTTVATAADATTDVSVATKSVLHQVDDAAQLAPATPVTKAGVDTTQATAATDDLAQANASAVATDITPNAKQHKWFFGLF